MKVDGYSYDTYGIYKKLQQDQKAKDSLFSSSSTNKEEDPILKTRKEALKLLVERITLMDGKDYTKRSWKRLMRSLDSALSVRGSKNATASELNKVAMRLLVDMNRLDEVEEVKNPVNEVEKNSKLLSDAAKSIMNSKQNATAERIAEAYGMGSATASTESSAVPIIEALL